MCIYDSCFETHFETHVRIPLFKKEEKLVSFYITSWSSGHNVCGSTYWTPDTYNSKCGAAI